MCACVRVCFFEAVLGFVQETGQEPATHLGGTPIFPTRRFITSSFARADRWMKNHFKQDSSSTTKLEKLPMGNGHFGALNEIWNMDQPPIAEKRWEPIGLGRGGEVLSARVP